MKPVPTLRRLNDRERYWGLTFPQWAGVFAAGGLIYGGVRVSPLSAKPTITILLLLCGFAGTVLAGVSGQALSPLRQLQAISSYRRAPKRWVLSERPDKGGLVLSTAPVLDSDFVDDIDLDWEMELDEIDDSDGPEVTR